MPDARQILANASRSIEINEQFEQANFYAVMPDGTIFQINNTRIRPPVEVREVNRAGFIEWLRGLPQKS